MYHLPWTLCITCILVLNQNFSTYATKKDRKQPNKEEKSIIKNVAQSENWICRFMRKGIDVPRNLLFSFFLPPPFFSSLLSFLIFFCFSFPFFFVFSCFSEIFVYHTNSTLWICKRQLWKLCLYCKQNLGSFVALNRSSRPYIRKYVYWTLYSDELYSSYSSKLYYRHLFCQLCTCLSALHGLLSDRDILR